MRTQALHSKAHGNQWQAYAEIRLLALTMRDVHIICARVVRKECGALQFVAIG